MSGDQETIMATHFSIHVKGMCVCTVPGLKQPLSTNERVE
jgi:hypothetical protein